MGKRDKGFGEITVVIIALLLLIILMAIPMKCSQSGRLIPARTER